ncbi:hypothetical protein [Nonomuraea sp. NPDC050202]|uniref:hypothetical protein n=1 Tax=Nonomuraea sp. NPDC050202 TaxID=3155035 RepID=UPI0033F90F5A
MRTSRVFGISAANRPAYRTSWKVSAGLHTAYLSTHDMAGVPPAGDPLAARTAVRLSDLTGRPCACPIRPDGRSS